MSRKSGRLGLGQVRDTNNLLLVLTNQKGKITRYQFLTMNYYSNQTRLKLVLNIVFFTTKQDGICDYNTQCSMSGGLMLDKIIMNLLTNITEKKAGQ